MRNRASFRRAGWWVLTAALVAVLTVPARAETLEDQVQRLEAQVQALLQSNSQQQGEIARLRSQIAALSSGQPGTPDAAAALDQVIEDKVNQAVGSIDVGEEAVKRHQPSWLHGLRLYGDIRLRYEGRFLEDPSYPQDRNRGRFRLRVGFDKTWENAPDWKLGFRLASGGTSLASEGSEPTSTNQTFDNFFTKKLIWIDRAWVRWAPQEGLLEGLELIGGKMPQPFLTTWNHWDTDVNPEGVFEKYTVPFFGDFKPYGNFAQFFVNEHSRTPADMSLLVYGGGFDWKLFPDNPVTVSFATNYWDFTHVHDNTPLSRGGNPVVEVNGKTYLAAEDFDILDFVWNVKGKVFRIPFKAYGNFGWNTGVDRDANDPDYDDQWSVGLKLGENKKKGDLSLEGAYVYNEPNSGFGYFMDGDMGQADHRAGVIRSFFNLTDFATFGGSIFFIDEFTADEDEDYNTLLQLDLSLKF